MLKITDVSNLVTKEEELEFETALKNSRKLKNFYNKALERGWDEYAALLETYDEWFYYYK